MFVPVSISSYHLYDIHHLSIQPLQIAFRNSKVLNFSIPKLFKLSDMAALRCAMKQQYNYSGETQ